MRFVQYSIFFIPAKSCYGYFVSIVSDCLQKAMIKQLTIHRIYVIMGAMMQTKLLGQIIKSLIDKEGKKMHVSTSAQESVPKASKRFKHPLLGGIVWTILGYALSNLLGLVVALFLGIISVAVGMNDADSDTFANTYSAFAIAIGALLVLYCFHSRYKKDGLHNFITSGNIALAALLIIPGILYSLSSLLNASIAPTLHSIAISAQAGITEEIVFRALPIAFMMRAYKFDEKKIPVAVLISSAVFGLFHFSNLLLGAPPIATTLQVLNAFAIGVFFGAVYARTGNILFCLLNHTLHDIFALMDEAAVEQNGLMKEMELNIAVVFAFVVWAVLIAIGLYDIRKAKRGEISTRWRKIWSYTEPAKNAEVSAEI